MVKSLRSSTIMLPIEESIFDPAIQTENIGHPPDDLLECGKCGRKSAPDRVNCIYCGESLNLRSLSDSVRLRKLEPWERGWNLVLLNSAPEHSAEAAKILGTTPEKLDEIKDQPLPVARVENASVADLICSKLSTLGFGVKIVPDTDLNIDGVPTRLRTLWFTEDGLVLSSFNTGASEEVKWEDVVLIVSGTIIEGQTESLEKRRRNAETKLIDSNELSKDRQVLDIYARSDNTGSRIYLAGFDFSFLGPAKGLLGSENLGQLISELQSRAPQLKHVQSYNSIRHFLDEIWPVESRVDTKGFIRTGLGRKGFGSVTSTSNLTQFTKYSRLQWHLL